MTRNARARFSILVSFAALGAFTALFEGCGSNDNRVAPPSGGPRAKRGEFELSVTGLGDPSPGHYEAWFVIGGQPRSGGKFRVTSNGKISDLAGTEVPGGILRVDPGLDLNAATSFFITLEPDNDASAAPTSTRLLAGTFAGASANLDVATALGVSFGGADGTYYLDTPTTETVKDFNRGIVFQLGDCGQPRATSVPNEIPALPQSGWTYEGWVMRPSGAAFIAYSTGRFLDPCDFDSDRAGQGAGTFGDDTDADSDTLADGLPMPAQDFVNASGSIPPLVLDEGVYIAAVSIEPEPDNSGLPFFLRVLDTDIPAAQSVVTLTQSGLGPIGDGHFELWHRTEANENFSIGKFRVNESGGLEALDGTPITSFTAAGDLLLSQRLFITVEPEGDASPAPSRSTMLTGALRDSTEFGDSTAVMRPDFAVTNGLFEDPERPKMGEYILNTFTTLDTTDFDNGIWFFKTHPEEEFSDSTTLVLPVLRDGWTYEGWVERLSTGDVYSTGRFLSPGGVSDGDRAGITAGTDGIDLNQDGRADGPLYPGQDFVRAFGNVPASLDLDGGDFRTFISIEPGTPDGATDIDSMPFILPVLEDELIEPVGAFVVQPLSRSPSPPPSATARISRGPVTRALTNRASEFPTGRVTIGTASS